MSLMDENEELLELLKPVIAMREEWLERSEHAVFEMGVEESAEKINLLLGSTLAAYKYVIEKQLPEESFPHRLQNLSGALVGQKSINLSHEIDFYGDFHCWKMNELINKLTFESSRTAISIRWSLLREILLKQLEFCHLMINFSYIGDIWDRSFGAAIGLMTLLYKDENPAQGLTQTAIYECLHDSETLEFSYPRFRYAKEENTHLIELLGLGIEIYLLSERFIPELSDGGNLYALLNEDTETIDTITYDTSAGTFFRERGLWWEFLDDAEEYFNEHTLIPVTAEFIQFFDNNNGKKGITELESEPYKFFEDD